MPSPPSVPGHRDTEGLGQKSACCLGLASSGPHKEDVGISQHKPNLPASFSAGLTHQSPNTAVVSLGSDLTLQCLPQMVPNSRDKEVEWCSKLKIKKMIKEDMGVLLHKENGFSNLTFTSVDEKYAGNYTCKMRISRCVGGKNKNCPCKSHKATGTYGGGEPEIGSGLCELGGMRLHLRGSGAAAAGGGQSYLMYVLWAARAGGIYLLQGTATRRFVSCRVRWPAKNFSQHRAVHVHGLGREYDHAREVVDVPRASW